MGALASIIGAISDDVVAALANANYPPLCPSADGTVGRILVGTAALYEAYSPPRIILEPTGWKLKAPDWGSAAVVVDDQERKNQNAMRTIRAKDVTFNCRCWGASPTGDITDDYDVTEALADVMIATLQKRLPGAHAIEEQGKYSTGPNINRDGREVVFGVTIFRPVLDALIPYALANWTDAQIAAAVANMYAPANVTGTGTVTQDGATSEQVTVTTP